MQMVGVQMLEQMMACNLSLLHCVFRSVNWLNGANDSLTKHNSNNNVF